MGQAAERLDMQGAGRFLKLHHQSFGFNPLEFPICARTPKRNGVYSAWIGHVPFAMSLIDMIRPRVFVEARDALGGFLLAFCQAVKELGLATRCFAVDTWQGDPHASFYGSDVLADLKGHHDGEYALFSELIESCFDDALPRFADKSIDLLHIDGFHTYEDARHDFETWLPKLSDQGVILFHDTEVRDREGFGVWRVWDEIKQKYPHFEFHHTHGLGVLAVGESIPEGLTPFFGATKTEAARIREYFQNLGDRVTELFNVSIQNSNLQELLHAVHEQLNARVEDCTRMGEELSSLRNESTRLIEEMSALRIELAAVREYSSRFAFRVVAKFANRLARFPRVYRLLRDAAHASAAARRSMIRGR